MSETITLERVPDPDAGKTIAEMKAADTYEEGTLEVARPYDDGGWSFTTTTGLGFGLSEGNMKGWMERTGKTPEPGMSVRVYPGGLGSFHGVDLDGEEVFWRTPAERVAERARWLAEHDRKQRREYAERKEQLDADFDALPEPLQRRIARFREEDPGFRVESEWYELFCCKEAAKLAEAARERAEKDAKEVDAFWSTPELRKKANGKVWDEEPESPELRWLLWAWALNTAAYDYDYKRQQRVTGCDDGHSGNTFGGSMHLAYQLLDDPRVIA